MSPTTVIDFSFFIIMNSRGFFLLHFDDQGHLKRDFLRDAKNLCFDGADIAVDQRHLIHIRRDLNRMEPSMIGAGKLVIWHPRRPRCPSHHHMFPLPSHRRNPIFCILDNRLPCSGMRGSWPSTGCHRPFHTPSPTGIPKSSTNVIKHGILTRFDEFSLIILPTY